MDENAPPLPESSSEGNRTGSFRPGEIHEIPRAPGVYMMIDSRKKVIYVGKAIDLRARVRQYFAESGGDERISVPLIRQSTHHIDTILTTNEKEAFLLENTLIKRHRPRYNVRLRDDKTYVSVRVDPNETWPRATVVRARRKDKALYFGPYTNAQSIRQTLNLLQKVFPLRSCSDSVFNNRSRPCLLHQIGRCCAPCVHPVDPDEYRQLVRNTIRFLKGQKQDLIASLRDRMQRLSESMQYERAAVVRDQIQALEQSAERQRVSLPGVSDSDVVGYAEEHGQAAVALLFFRDGQLVESQNWTMPVYGQPPAETLAHFVGQYYQEGRPAPGEVLLPEEPDDAEAIREWLGELRGGRVQVLAPQRGEKRRMVEMAVSNAAEVLARKLSGREQIDATLEALARKLELPEPPSRIECYDIATLQGSMSAGSQVVFTEGEPDKSAYRLFRIRAVEGQDDFAMMREVLTRRFRRSVERNEALPDLIIVDGGKGQLSTARQALAEVGLDELPVAALAKSRLHEGESQDDEKTRTPERLFVPGRANPVNFSPRSPAFYLLQRLRDEAHRFVNTYHGNLRRRAHLRSSLEDIPGIGPRRARNLLRHFGSLARVREAGVEALAGAPGMSRQAALDLHAFLHEGATEEAAETDEE